jgi:hypothetical protein
MINQVREILLNNIEKKHLELIIEPETLEQEFFSEYDYYTIHDIKNKKLININ